MAETTLDLRALPKAQAYAELLPHVDLVLEGIDDPIAAMATMSCLLHHAFGHLWTGFYRVVDNELVVGPFAGRPACIRIPFGQGVCGVAAQSGATQLVADVHAFPGHIACDPVSRSELVVPVKREGAVVAVIDIDSPVIARFDAEDAEGIQAVARLLADRIFNS